MIASHVSALVGHAFVLFPATLAYIVRNDYKLRFEWKRAQDLSTTSLIKRPKWP